MKMKRLLSACLVVCLLMGMWVVPAHADEVIEGTCGDNIVWKVEGLRLTITGTGPMYDYSPENRPPWYDYMADGVSRAGIDIVFVSKGVTRIGNYAFQYDTSTNGFRVFLEQDVKKVGHYSFARRDAIVYYLGDCPQIAEDAYVGCKCNQYYIYGWETSDMQLYGGDIVWKKASLKITTDTKTIYNLGEPIKPEDFAMVMDQYSTINPYQYTPRAIETEPYDNSVPGGKCVKVTVDGREFTHHYYVTDGATDCRDVKVLAIPAQKYQESSKICPEPTVLVGGGDYALVKDTHYKVSYANNKEVGTATATITGLGDWEDIKKEVTFAIVKRDIADASISISDEVYVGMPAEFSVTAKLGTKTMSPQHDFVLDAENCINIGEGICRVVGVNNYYGVETLPFKITNTSDEIKRVNGTHIGNIGDTLKDEVWVEEWIQTPGPAKFQVHCAWCYAYYQLYKLVGEEQVLVKTQEFEHRDWSDNFEYDFSAEYEEAYDDGLAIYILVCSWVDSGNQVFSGAQVLYVPARVPDATEMVMEEMEGTRDFRHAYLSAYGTDGNEGMLEWSSSDPSVAEVSMGTVTMKKPGSVTITAKYKDLQASCQVTVEQLNLKDATIVYYDTQTQKPQLIYDNILLKEGTDYTVHTEVKGNVKEVTVMGQGLFAGQLVQQFDALTGQPVGEKHSFDHCGDLTCNTCSQTRESDHKPAELWKKNAEEHWHLCQVCAEKTDVADHILSAADETVCTVCGALVMPGDVDENYEVNIDDVVTLLLHVSMPDLFPIDAEADFDGNGEADIDDVVTLLLHVSMPDIFPLE